jgi:hypothetical protein
MDGPTTVYLSTNIPFMIAQIIYFIFLADVILVLSWVGWDARRRGLSWLAVIGWTVFSISFIGLALYLFSGRRDTRKYEERIAD